MKQLPVTVRRSIEFIGLFFLVTAIASGKLVIFPLLTAVYFSILLLPCVRFFRRRKLPESISIVLSLLIFFICIGVIVWFFSSQVSRLISDFPQIKKNVMLHLKSLSDWINSKTNFSTEKQLQILNEQSGQVLNNAGVMITGAAASLSSVFIFVGLLPIYIFLVLFYRNLLVHFTFMWFPKDDYGRVQEGIRETESIIKSYLVGLLIQITYITVLLGGSLFIFGIEHAFLIGAIFAILNLIPYIGALFGNIIGVLLTLTSSQELSPVFTVLITIAVVQFLDNNILMPKIVGSKVKINALASIVAVIVGGSIGGVPGMFLSLPTVAVIKIIFDRTDDLKQWGVLLGDTNTKKSQLYEYMIKAKGKKAAPKEEDE
ncbi:MAG: AI-2E family transporter [Bacteroidota bacterium]|nr:AI-2E family transporter [Bacteroidota bacterium]